MIGVLGVTMLTNTNFPLKFHRVAGLYLLLVTVLALAFSLKMELTRTLIAATIMYTVGMLDFTIMYFSMLRALRRKPERSLKIMRDGMGVRFVAALVFAVAAIKLNYMPWAVLLGLLMMHVVILLDSVFVSIKFNK